MANQKSTTNNIILEINEKYQEFLDKLNLLKKEHERLINEYREKLKQRKLSKLRERLNIKE